LGSTGNGSGITVGAGVTLTLRNITFKGKDGNTAALITVIDGGQLILEEGAVITENKYSGIHGGGVYVTGNSKLTMTGGVISGNTVFRYGGGVYLADSSLVMSGTAAISNNKVTSAPAASGGGVYLAGNSSLVMSGNAAISGNNNNGDNGGGVCVTGTSKLTMSGNASISRNTSNRSGGGVYVDKSATFNMYGGVISGNNSGGYPSGGFDPSGGGGVYFSGIFNMSGGVIYGSGETGKDSAGNNLANSIIQYGSGAAVYKDGGTSDVPTTEYNVIAGKVVEP
jgi:predicted outer membrane repeat protein